MLDGADNSTTAKQGLGFPAGAGQLRWFYADELLHQMLFPETITRHILTPLRDLYECSEHFWVTWSSEHPGKKLEFQFDYLIR